MISVILPAFNSGEFIRSAIDSVLNQSHQYFELIVVDDCSTDNTVEVVRGYALVDCRIKLYILDANSGAGAARNFGLIKASYNFISFLDSDDIWHCDKLMLQYDFMIRNNAGISHTSYSFIDKYGDESSGFVKVSKFVTLEKYMSNTEIGLSTAMLNLDVVGKVKFDLARTRQDTLLWIGLLSRGYISQGLDIDLCSYRISDRQISKNKFKMLYRTFVVYWAVKVLSPWARARLFLCYAVNAILKRM